MYGIAPLIAVVFVLWAPLFLFSSANPFTTVMNNAQDMAASLQVRVEQTGGSFNIYTLYEVCLSDAIVLLSRYLCRDTIVSLQDSPHPHPTVFPCPTAARRG